MKQKEPDKFFRLKFIAYAWSQGLAENFTYEDFVNFAKFQLCEARGYLMADPVWEKYSDEGILVEYYALRMFREKEYLRAFEAQIPGNSEEKESIYDWFDQEIEKNKPIVEALKKTAAKIEAQGDAGEFEFVPPSRPEPGLR